MDEEPPRRGQPPEGEGPPLPATVGMTVTSSVQVGGQRTFAVEIQVDAPQFDGHFPSEPIFPAVAQLCDLVLPHATWAWPDLGPLRGAPQLKFSRPVRPGDRLDLRLERRQGGVVRFEITGADGVCGSGTLEFGEP